MEFHEIPFRVSRYLRVVGEHWVSSVAPGRVQIGGPRKNPNPTLRVWLWTRSGLEAMKGRHIRPSCGVPWCCRPEHCHYPKAAKRYDKRGSPGRKRRRFATRFEQAAYTVVLERRGFVRKVGDGALRVGEYRLHQKELVVTWQLPARGWYARSSGMTLRIMRARAVRTAKQRRAA